METIVNKTDAYYDNRRRDEIIDGRHGIYEKYVMPRAIHFVCGLKPMMDQRRKIVPRATGRVLEIGIGSGRNLPFYNSDRITHVWGLDPSPEMWALSKKNRESVNFDLEFIHSGAESIPLDDNSADTVLITYALCTIPDVTAALAEVRRVLKPGGSVLFCEHGTAPDASVLKWQNRLNPVWKKIAGGCHLNRQVPLIFEQSGFSVQEMDASYIPGWKPASFNYRGMAQPR